MDDAYFDGSDKAQDILVSSNGVRSAAVDKIEAFRIVVTDTLSKMQPGYYTTGEITLESLEAEIVSELVGRAPPEGGGVPVCPLPWLRKADMLPLVQALRTLLG